MTGRRCPTSTGTRATARATLPVRGWQAPPVPGALPDRQRRRTCEPDRHHRRVARGERRQRRLRAVGGRPVRLRRHRRRGLDQLRQRRPRPARRRLRRRRRGLQRRRARPRFEDDGDTLDGWTVPGPPEGSPPNANDWIAGTAADAPPHAGRGRRRARSRASLRSSRSFGLLRAAIRSRPPAASSTTSTGSASRSRTRPGRSTRGTSSRDDRTAGDSVVVHELAHQWTGDSLALAAWQHIWLNEGFATYTEWLWSEREGTAPRRRSSTTSRRPPGRRPVLDAARSAIPGRTSCSTSPVYDRGAMTLQALRVRDRRRRLLPAAEAVGAPARRRQRHDARVHRARRADLRPGPRRLLPDLAVHAREAAGDRARGCTARTGSRGAATAAGASNGRGSARRSAIDSAPAPATRLRLDAFAALAEREDRGRDEREDRDPDRPPEGRGEGRRERLGEPRAQVLGQALERPRRGRGALADLRGRELVLDLALQHDRQHRGADRAADPLQRVQRARRARDLVALAASRRPRPSPASSSAPIPSPRTTSRNASSV